MLNIDKLIDSLRNYKALPDTKRKRRYKMVLKVVSSCNNLSQVDYSSITLNDIHLLKNVHESASVEAKFCKAAKESLRKMNRCVADVDFI